MHTNPETLKQPAHAIRRVRLSLNNPASGLLHRFVTERLSAVGSCETLLSQRKWAGVERKRRRELRNFSTPSRTSSTGRRSERSVRVNTKQFDKIIAAKVGKPATLAQRSAAASRNEMHTDIAAANDNADAAKIPDYYKHGANEYQRGYDDGFKAAKAAAIREIERGFGRDIKNAEDAIDPARCVGHTLHPRGGGPCE